MADRLIYDKIRKEPGYFQFQEINPGLPYPGNTTIAQTTVGKQPLYFQRPDLALIDPFTFNKKEEDAYNNVLKELDDDTRKEIEAYRAHLATRLYGDPDGMFEYAKSQLQSNTDTGISFGDPNDHVGTLSDKITRVLQMRSEDLTEQDLKNMFK